MNSLQRACAVGSVTWLVAHAPLPALLSLRATHSPALSLLAVVVVTGVSLLVLRPLRGGPMALRPAAALAAAAVLPLSGLAVMPQLEPEAWRTFANWWPGATQVIVAALVVRRQWSAAVVGELGSAAVIAGCVLGRGLPGAAVDIAALNQPALLWFTASVGVRFLFDRTAREVARHTADAGTAVAAAAATSARAAGARRRREDLDAHAVPLLRQVATTEVAAPGWGATVRAAVAVERQLRDDLRARALLDDEVRAALRAARARGAVVDVVDDRTAAAPDDAFVLALRPVLAAAARACGTGALTVRLSPAPGHASLSVDGTPQEAAAVARVVRGGAAGLVADVDVLDGSLWTDLRPPDPRS